MNTEKPAPISYVGEICILQVFLPKQLGEYLEKMAAQKRISVITLLHDWISEDRARHLERVKSGK